MTKEQVKETTEENEGVNDDAAADAGQDADGADQGADGDGQEDGDQADVYIPEGLPEHLAGGNDQETIDKLKDAYLGARRELSTKHNIPENLDDYKIELPEDVAAQVIQPGEDGKDPVFEQARATLHENNIPADVGKKLLEDFFGSVIALKAAGNDDGASGEDGAGDAENQADFEYQSFGGMEKAQPIVEGAQTFIDGLQSSGKLTSEAAEEFKLLSYHGQGLTLLNELRPLLGDKPIPKNPGGDAAGGEQITEEMLRARVADDRYAVDKDPQFIAETTRMFKAFYNKPEK
jgi:hypothetical protein